MKLVLAMTSGLLDGAEPAVEVSLKTTFGPNGLASLSYHGRELLVKRPAWVRYTSHKADGTPATFSEGKDQHKKVEGDTITREYEGLTVITTARRKKDVLRLELTFKNTKDQALTDVGFQPLTVQFPRRPKGARWKWGYTVTTDNEGEPGVVVADWGDAKLVACCDEVERPVTFGFEGNFGSGAPNPLSIGLAKLGAGETRTYRFSLRFGGPDADTIGMARGVYEQFAKVYPDVLIFPEFGRYGYWECCMPYGELRGGSVRTSDAIRAAYPGAGSTLAVGDGDYLGHWDDLLEGAADGDIHLFRGWFGDPLNQLVKRLYQEADYVRRARTVHPAEQPLAEALAAKDPLTRWLALNRVKAGDRAAHAVIVRLLPGEQDWIVQKKMIELLGASTDVTAVAVLVPLVRDRVRGLDHFAAAALGRLGTPAGRALVELATDKDPAVAKKALVALAENVEPKALPVLLALTDSPKPAVRGVAIRALGVHRSSESLAKLVSLLGEADKDVLIAACAAISRQKDRTAVKPLVELIERSVTSLHNNDVRVAAGDALEAITGLEYGPYERAWRAALNAGKL